MLHSCTSGFVQGVYMNAEVYLNGRLLGFHPYGYTGFEFDVTDSLLALSLQQQQRPVVPRINVLAVRVSNLGQNSRWYSGSVI